MKGMQITSKQSELSVGDGGYLKGNFPDNKRRGLIQGDHYSRGIWKIMFQVLTDSGRKFWRQLSYQDTAKYDSAVDEKARPLIHGTES